MAVEDSGSAAVSGPGLGRARHPAAAVTGGNRGASAPPWRTAEFQPWRWRWGRPEGGPAAGRPGEPGERRAGGCLGRRRWCTLALQRRLR